MSVNLYPQPRSVELSQGVCVVPVNFKLCFEYGADREMFDIVKLMSARYRRLTGSDFYPVPDRKGKLDINVWLHRAEGLGREEYLMHVDEVRVEICYGTHAGAFYGLQSFISLMLNYNGRIPCMELRDFPSVADRAFLLDVSRSRVPQLQTVYDIIDILSVLRYNQLQLYMETPAAELPDFPEYAAETEALTPFELMQIDDYCRRRYIRLIPNHNSFGHLHTWLRKPELRDISALPNGYALDPTNPGTEKFLSKLYDSLLPCFSSDTFNAGCDEVSELDKEGSRTKARCDSDGGIGPLLLQHVRKVHSMLAARGKKMMMWADMLISHPEVLSGLPQDIVTLVWGYETDTDFESADRLLRDSGFGFYNVCGTSSWACVMPDNDKARQNISSAVRSCIKNGGSGVMLADWGDAGHCQPLMLSYISIAYAAGLCWNAETDDYALAMRWVDGHVFRTVGDSFAQIIYNSGALTPKNGNCTDAFINLLLDADNLDVVRLPEADIRASVARISEYSAQAAAMRMECADADIVREEFVSSAEVYTVLADILLLKYEQHFRGFVSDWENKLRSIEAKIRAAKIRYRKVWSRRYRINGWYGFWWFVDRQMLKLRDYFCFGRLDVSRAPLFTYLFEEPDDNIK